jgi:maltodextrin utilization protein YvdJ
MDEIKQILDMLQKAAALLTDKLKIVSCQEKELSEAQISLDAKVVEQKERTERLQAREAAINTIEVKTLLAKDLNQIKIQLEEKAAVLDNKYVEFDAYCQKRKSELDEELTQVEQIRADKVWLENEKKTYKDKILKEIQAKLK